MVKYTCLWMEEVSFWISGSSKSQNSDLLLSDIPKVSNNVFLGGKYQSKIPLT